MRNRIEQAYQELPHDAARTVRLFGHLPARTLTADVVSAVCAFDLARASALLTHLLTANLVQYLRTETEKENEHPVTCVFYDPVAACAGEWAQDESPDARDEALRRWVEWYLAADMARSDDDRRGLAQALHGIGDSHQQAGHGHVTVIPPLQEALAIREEIGYTRGAALTRMLLGGIASDQRDWDTAHDFLLRARADLLALTAPDAYNAARALAFLGRARARCGDYDTGVRDLCEAYDEFGATGSRRWAARTQEWLGEAALEHGHLEAAQAYFTDARVQYAACHSPRDVARLDEHLRTLGTT